MDLSKIDRTENLERMRRGDLYYAFTPDLLAARTRCSRACQRFNNAGDVSRRRLVELWRDIVGDTTPLPPKLDDPEADEQLFAKETWVESPVRMDYGTNVQIGKGAFINFYATFVDTCLITIGARTLVGPGCSFYSGSHPLDPAIRNGTNGPETGQEIHIGEDCWLGGNVIILPGVTLGRGVTIGAGSVVTKDIPAFHVAAGNPARILRRIETTLSDSKSDVKQTVPTLSSKDSLQGAEVPMRDT